MFRHVTVTLAFAAVSAAITAQTAATAVSSDNILLAFKQGAQNNCAITAVIKAAIATFGMDATNGVFTSDITEDNGAHNIVMRDGSKVSITKEQIKQAQDMAKWAAAPSHSIDDPIFQRASVLYAAMARHAVDLNSVGGFSDAKDYANSVQRLSDPGRDSDVQPQLLGLACKQIALSDVSHTAYVHSNYYHAAFATLSDYDQDGEKLSLVPYFQKYHHKIFRNGESNRENFLLVDPGGPLTVDQRNPCPSPAP